MAKKIEGKSMWNKFIEKLFKSDYLQILFFNGYMIFLGIYMVIPPVKEIVKSYFGQFDFINRIFLNEMMILTGYFMFVIYIILLRAQYRTFKTLNKNTIFKEFEELIYLINDGLEINLSSEQYIDNNQIHIEKFERDLKFYRKDIKQYKESINNFKFEVERYKEYEKADSEANKIGGIFILLWISIIMFNLVRNVDIYSLRTVDGYGYFAIGQIVLLIIIVFSINKYEKVKKAKNKDLIGEI